MSIPFVYATIEGPEHDKKQVEFLVDSGATYSVIPNSVWRTLKLKPEETLTVSLADGRKLKRRSSRCRIEYRGRNGETPVILGEENDEALLGALTLENLGLVLNPLNRTLSPMKIRM